MTQGEMESLYQQLAALKSQLNDVKQENTRYQSEVADAVWDLNRAETTNTEQVEWSSSNLMVLHLQKKPLKAIAKSSGYKCYTKWNWFMFKFWKWLGSISW